MMFLLASSMVKISGGAVVSGGGPLLTTTLNMTLSLNTTVEKSIVAEDRRLQTTTRDWVVFYNILPSWSQSYCWAWGCPGCTPSSTKYETAYLDVVPVEIDSSILSSMIEITLYWNDGSPTPCGGNPTSLANANFEYHQNGINIYGLGVSKTGNVQWNLFRNPVDNGAHAVYFLHGADGYPACDLFFTNSSGDFRFFTGAQLGSGFYYSTTDLTCDTFALHTSYKVICGTAEATTSVSPDKICPDASMEFVVAGNASNPAYPLTLLYVPGRRCDVADSCAQGTGSGGGPPSTMATSAPTPAPILGGCGGSPPTTATLPVPTRAPGCPDALYPSCPSGVTASNLPPCDDDNLVPGDYCASKAGECGTDINLDNCGTFDVYAVSQCIYSASGGLLKPAKYCPSSSTMEIMPNCADPHLHYGEYCEGDGECETSNDLDNCGDSDVYVVGNDCVNAYGSGLNLYPSLQCPTDKLYQYIPHCASPGLGDGDYCEGDSECDTDNTLNNCDDPNFPDFYGFDIYVIGS